MNYYEVLPLRKTGLESRTFTYSSSFDIKIGCIVQIPLRNRNLKGIVFEKVSKPRYPTKKILKILEAEPVLTDWQVALAKKIAKYYFATLGETLRTFLPFEFGKKRRTILPEIEVVTKENPLKATPNQEDIIKKIIKSKAKTKHLIHGVTGSGKTEIYLQLVADALKKNQGAMILVPEISLTPQTLTRFEKRFPGRIAVWHSNLKETEKYHTWQNVKSGSKKIVLGTRSTLFLPIKDLAYIIIDEEHESSYKQDQSPRYQATKVASWLAEMLGTKVILGSATPKIESYYRALHNEYKYYSLDKRVIQNNLPPVTIVDMREEFRKKNKNIFSDLLTESIQETLDRKRQVLLFLNRRGASSFVVCRDCGYIEKCPNCDLPLVYHPNENQILKCHHCDYRKQIPSNCPSCNSYAIKYFGLGTQRVEIEIKKSFPKAKVARMDRDTTQKRGSHQVIYEEFKNKNFDILIGTQIIAKGWDLPDIDLVGVIAADTTLNLPDYKSAERTFGLLTQVAGRTGRGYNPGHAIIQTYSPKNYAIDYAKKHDYIEFYKKEIEFRKKYQYPPFTSLIKLGYKSKDELRAEREAKEMSALLLEKIGKKSEILGPNPSFIFKKQGYFNWQILVKVKSQREVDIFKIVETLREIMKPGWIVDVDPESSL